MATKGSPWTITTAHVEVLAAVEAGDEDAAAAAMRRHVYLRPVYEQGWQSMHDGNR